VKIELVERGATLAGRAAELLLSAKDPAECVVVFPGKRPAHFLRAAMAEKNGAAFEPPRVFSMDSFASWLLGELGLALPQAAPLDAAALLYKEFGKEAGELAGAKGRPELDEFLPWAGELLAAFEELKINLVDPRAAKSVDEVLAAAGGFKARFSKFSSVYAAFYSLLAGEGRSTRASGYAELAANSVRAAAALAKKEKVVFAGLFALTAAEKALLRELAALPNVTFLLDPGPGLSEQFSFLGGLPAAADGEKTAARLHFHKSADNHGQVFQLNGVFSGEAAGRDEVIVLPDPKNLFPVVNWTLPLAGPHNISMGYPLTATPVYSLFEGLFALVERESGGGWPVDAYVGLLMHPYLKNLSFRGAGLPAGSAELSRVLAHSLEEALSSGLGKTVALEAVERGEYKVHRLGLGEFCARRAAAVADVTPAQALAHFKALHDAAIRPFTAPENVADFAGKLLALVSRVSEDSTAANHPYYGLFIYSLIEALHALKASALGPMKFRERGGYFRLLRSYLATAATRLPGTPLEGLQVLGFLETRGLAFRKVYFLDANEGVIPGGSKEDTLLPFELRAALGLSTHKTREAIYKYHFHSLLARAEEAHLFYLDTADQEPSRYVRRLMWDAQAAAGKFGVKEEEARFALSFTHGGPGPVKKSPALLEHLSAHVNISASNLDAYLNCGLQFYYGAALGLEEKAGLSSDFDARDTGILIHKVLEDFFRPWKGKVFRPSAGDAAALDALLEKNFTAAYPGREDGFSYILKSRVRERLRAVLAWHAGSSAGAEILELEKRFERPYKVGRYAVRLVGKADRIDRCGGKLRIIDYKSGSSAGLPAADLAAFADRAAWPDTLGSVQLPFYLMLYGMENPDLKPGEADAWLWTLGAMKGEIAQGLLARLPAGEVKAYDAACREAVETLIAEIFDPELPFEPAADPARCGWCPFRQLCGRQWVKD
jgi:hypothetical protein